MLPTGLSPARLGQACARAGRLLLDSVLPPLCLGCNEIVETPGALCAACWQGFSFVAPPYCARCAAPFAHDLGQGALCGACLARPPRYRRARAALVYDARSRRLVLPFKHGDRTDIARACGRWMARAGAELLAEADLVAPVPLHWRRLFTRRYNQAQLLARVAVREAAVGIRPRLAPDLLRRRALDGLAERASRPGTAEQCPAGLRYPSALGGRSRRQDRVAGRRRADDRGDGRGLHPGFAARRGSATLMC